MKTTTAPTTGLWFEAVTPTTRKPTPLTATTETSPTERQILDGDLSPGQRQMLVVVCNKADRCDPRNATVVRMQNAAEDRAEREAEVAGFIEPRQKGILRLEYESPPKSPTEWVLEEFGRLHGYKPQRTVVCAALARFGIPPTWRRTRSKR